MMVLYDNATVHGDSQSVTTLLFMVVLYDNATVQGGSLSMTILSVVPVYDNAHFSVVPCL